MDLVIIIMGLVGIILIIASITIDLENKVYIIERFGKFYKTVNSGIVFTIPFIDKIKCSMSAENNKSSSIVNCISSEGGLLICEYYVYWRIADYEKATYEIEDATHIGKNIIELSNKLFVEMFDGMSSSKFDYLEDRMNQDLKTSINNELYERGINIEKFEIKNKKMSLYTN